VKREAKAARVQQILDRLYPSVDAPLEHADAFTLLVAVLLSAQCTDVRVNQVTPKLFARAGTAAEMMELDEGEILEIIKTCGLAPQKSKAIHSLSCDISNLHGGRVPDTFEELEALRGVGHKTASVVMSQFFGRPAFPVDTHINRLAKRWGLSRGKNVEQVERDLKKLYPEGGWGRLHLQIIFFGREHCPARGHDLGRCPICSWAASKAQVEREQRR
jgi:endonuclease-3